MMGRAERSGRDSRRAVAGEVGDPADARGLNGFGVGHRQRDRDEAPGHHRLAGPLGVR
jgi:hypothetical protein